MTNNWKSQVLVGGVWGCCIHCSWALGPSWTVWVLLVKRAYPLCLCVSVLLPKKKFVYHYKNVRWARGRHETYLCFVVKRRVGPDTLTFDFGHLRNRNGCHVEVIWVGQDEGGGGYVYKVVRTILSIHCFRIWHTATVPALHWSPVSWFVGVRRRRREEAQLLHHLVLLLVSLCQLLHQTVPVPQQAAQPSAQDFRVSPLLLWHGGQPGKRGPTNAEKGRRADHSHDLQR